MEPVVHNSASGAPEEVDGDPRRGRIAKTHIRNELATNPAGAIDGTATTSPISSQRFAFWSAKLGANRSCGRHSGSSCRRRERRSRTQAANPATETQLDRDRLRPRAAPPLGEARRGSLRQTKHSRGHEMTTLLAFLVVIDDRTI